MYDIVPNYDYIFNSHVHALFLYLNYVAMDPSIALQSAKFMFVVTINDFLMSCVLNVLSQE